MRDDDTDLIWEAYDRPKGKKVYITQDQLDDEQADADRYAQGIEIDLNDLVHQAEKHFDKFRGKADHEDILSHLESHYKEFFNANYSKFANAEQVVSYVEDGGLRQDLKDQLGLDDDQFGAMKFDFS